jgi:hypothetical protein
MNPSIMLARPICSQGENMKLRIAIVFALVASLSPMLAVARTHTPSVHQHGSTMHDRAPHARAHESQPHH